MKCPVCESKKSRVLETRQYDADGEVLKRRRQCSKCKQRFSTFEGYEVADPEQPFRVSEAVIHMEKASTWLSRPARNIPIVRDALAKYTAALLLLKEEDERRAEGAHLVNEDT